jgi:hypothetical protein
MVSFMVLLNWAFGNISDITSNSQCKFARLRWYVMLTDLICWRTRITGLHLDDNRIDLSDKITESCEIGEAWIRK